MVYNVLQYQYDIMLLINCKYKSSIYKELKQFMKRCFKHLKPFVSARFHAYKRDVVSRIDLNMIGLISVFETNKLKHRAGGQQYMKFDKLLTVSTSLHINWENKYLKDTSLTIDTKCTLNQSANHPWHYIKAEHTECLRERKTLLKELRQYEKQLNEMKADEFYQQKYLVNDKLLRLLPSFKQLYMKSRKVYMNGDFDRISAKYTKKRWENEEKEKFEA
eukprot:500518_1